VYWFRDTLGPVDLAFTDRLGGVSAAPYSSLNLSISGSDDAQAKARNHRLLLDDFAPGDRLADVYQVHGGTVVIAEPGHRPEADGLVSDHAGVVLMVRAADCVPVLLADPEAGVIGAAHAGRAGLVAGVAPATVVRMRELGAGSSGAITAWIGPSICGACYEVPADLQAEVAAVEPASKSTTAWGTPALDIAAGIAAQLARQDVVVVDASACTRESPSLYSYRRDGAGAGRQAGVIRLCPDVEDLIA
jgi:YfiH family protein